MADLRRNMERSMLVSQVQRAEVNDKISVNDEEAKAYYAGHAREFTTPSEMRALKLRHMGIEEATDVLSFPIDGREQLPVGVPRQLGDVVLCPQVVGEAWRAPLVHGLLHLLGYDHGEDMERRERELVPES